MAAEVYGCCAKRGTQEVHTVRIFMQLYEGESAAPLSAAVCLRLQLRGCQIIFIQLDNNIIIIVSPFCRNKMRLNMLNNEIHLS